MQRRQHPQTGRSSYLVVELKQWSEAKRFEDSDVRVRIGGYGYHPLEQAPRLLPLPH
ncbi:hypothetical protein [Ornithinimicrobium sp. CNJ-824]|uniref:hypothetical protein n=1 Tax=Ornithinimicrobium sp. CNJ-824 TaxID=1904966 RepID=UPI00192CE5E6|nr:hypothetical protein [Ornithinimicrobium sp. CNJ-824]